MPVQACMKMSSLALALVAVVAFAAPTEAPRPERVVDGTTVISARHPRMNVSVPAAAHYVGAERWNLYDVADCEIHVFVEANRRRVVQRFYWVQFEGYLPHLPYNHYDYAKDALRRIQGLDFHVRARFGPTAETPRPDSDFERVRNLILESGYTLPPHMMNVRLVHLLDGNRKELMVIYSEDLAPTGYTSEDLRDGDKPAAAWGAVEKVLIERASRRIRFTH